MPLTASRGNVTHRPYTVRGRTLMEIDAAIQRSGPRDPNDGRRYSGCCIGTYTIRVTGRDWQFDVDSEGPPIRQRCRLGSGNLVVSCVIQVPRLASRLESAPAQREWERFLAAVEEHEDGHIGMYMTDARAVAQRISELSATGEGRNEREAQRAAQQALGQLITREYGDTQLEALAFAACARYDARNQHGRSQGAVLDRTIT